MGYPGGSAHICGFEIRLIRVSPKIIRSCVEKPASIGSNFFALLQYLREANMGVYEQILRDMKAHQKHFKVGFRMSSFNNPSSMLLMSRDQQQHLVQVLLKRVQ